MTPEVWYCPYCKHEVTLEPGTMMIEGYNYALIVHEECYQMSGEDEGYVRWIHQQIDNDDDKRFFPAKKF